MNAASDASQSNVMVQMRRSRDRDCVDAKPQQRVKVIDRRATNHPRDKITLFTVRIGDANELNSGESGQYAGMVRTHGTHTDDADSKRRTVLHGSHHVLILAPELPTKKHPTNLVACPASAGDGN